MNIPKKMKVGGIEYKVRYVDNLYLEGDKCNGTITFSTNTVSLEARMIGKMVGQTFIHELLHAIVEHMEIDLGEDEEKVVGALSKGLCAFMVQNPKVFVT